MISKTSQNTTDTPVLSVQNDRPIESQEKDKLRRLGFVSVIANQVSTLDAAAGGVVVALTGPWGCGKTSILNLVQERLDSTGSITVIRFNPWLFSGSEQLVQQFFSEYASALKLSKSSRLQKLSKTMADYGGLVSPVGIVTALEPYTAGALAAVKVLGAWNALRSKKSGSLRDLRAQIDKALRAEQKRFVIMIDDIDRLYDQEIHEVIRLVRLTADFPNTVYLLAYDKERVQHALGALGKDVPNFGQGYPEKIVQVSTEVPPVQASDIAGILADGIDAIMQNRRIGPYETRDLQNTFVILVRPRFSSLRDIKRYLNSVEIAVALLVEEVAFPDILAMEAIRLFLPRLWAELPVNVAALTDTSSSSSGTRRDTERRASVTGLLEVEGPEKRGVVESFLERVFPASGKYTGNSHYGEDWNATWSRGRRVAHGRVLRLYLEKNYPEGSLSATEVSRVFEALEDAESLNKLLEGYSGEALESLLMRLEDFEEEFPPRAAVIAAPILLKHGGRLSTETGRSFLDVGADLALTRVLLRLFRRLADETERLKAFQEIMKQLDKLSEFQLLLELVGHRKNAGSKLIHEKDWLTARDGFFDTVADTPAGSLAEERRLGSIVLETLRFGNEKQRGTLKAKFDNPTLAVRFLGATLQRSRSQVVGDVAATVKHDLPWNYLVELLGKKDLAIIVKAAGSALGTATDAQRMAVGIAEEYVNGIREPRDREIDADDD